MHTQVVIDEGGQGIGAVEAVARHGAKVSIAPAAVERMAASRRVVEGCLSDGRAHYGINTGFGSLSRTRIADHDVAALQRNLIRSHSAGVGPLLPVETVRGMMFLLAASLARGKSGARPVIAQTLVEMLNKGVTPAVPETGSVGASGDLAPLAHMALACIGEGHVVTDTGAVQPAADALRTAGIAALVLEAKEGLAMINGTHLMAAQAALLVADARALMRAAITAAAMSIDAARATDAFLDARVYEARAQRGPGLVAAAMRELLAGSEILVSHREDDPRVQDPYSFRCAPAVLGAAADAMLYVNGAVERELAAVTDNPLVFGPEGKAEASIISAGNFHGMPVAIPLDTLAIAVSHIAGISERRTFWMLAAYEKESELPHYLTPRPALNSGLMIAQYTAAACCNEIIGLAAPASVANIPTSAGIEDYNSFGPRSAAKARRALELATHVVAIEILCAAQGLEYHRPLRSGRVIELAHQRIRSVIPVLTDDRPIAPDIGVISGLMRHAGWMSAAHFDGVETGPPRGIS
ncbi:MAG: Histidine ammonia-lyase [Phycisphaerales bacterium]|nr:Histidine ammonia-lyase [Phycisphaerales bacterium]